MPDGMGAGGDVNAIFGILSMIIAVPTGVKVFNWLFTMFGGRVTYSVPIMYAMGFMVTFVIGGMTGVLMAVPPADFVLHNSLFLVASLRPVAANHNPLQQYRRVGRCGLRKLPQAP